LKRSGALSSRGAAACALAGLVAGCAASLGDESTGAAAPLTREAAFDAALDRWAAAPGHEGVSASVILGDGTQWTGAAGNVGGSEPLREEHLIWIASITKTMTGAIVLQLAGESRLALDDPLGRWLAPRANVDPSITLRQLLNHTNGLDNYTASAALGRAIAADPAHVFTGDELLAFLGPPRFAPGARTEYTNTSFVLLGLVAEAVAGRPLVELYHERLWDPLRLGEIFLPGHEAPPGPVARALGANGIVSPLDQMALLSTGHYAWGLMSNARTIARWGRALFAGEVISPAMQAEMRTLVPAAGNIPGESGAGLGIRAYAYLGRTQLGHSGGAPLGSSLLLHDPTSGVTLAVLMNQGQNAGHFLLAPELLEIAARP
jgi:D-alanyl-D-alanine carboxypeptidase